jgi:cytochrome c oxidase subunit IV
MENHSHSHVHSPEVTYHHHPSEGTGRIWKTTIYLSVITLVELSFGFLMYFTDFPAWADLFIKGVIVILSLWKAFYIVSVFMHLGDEIRNMIMTIVVPLLLFVWFIAAFLWDGSSYRALRNRYDVHYKETTLDRELRSADTATHPLH